MSAHRSRLLSEVNLGVSARVNFAARAEWEWRWRTAIEVWANLAAISTDEVRTEAIAGQARGLIEVGQVNQAKEQFSLIADQIEGIEGLAHLAKMQGLADISAWHWDECTTRFPKQATGFLGKAMLLFEREAFAEADAMLCDIVKSWPDSLPAAIMWGRCATAAKNWTAARARWEALLARYPADRGVSVGYIRYLAAIGDSAAVSSFLATLAGDPATLAYCLAEYHLAHDDFEPAIEPVYKLVELEDLPWNRIYLASMLIRHGSPQTLQTAQSLLKSLLDQSPESISIKVKLIEAYIALDHPVQAKALLRTVPLEDHRPDLETLRAWALHHEGDENAAKQRWTGILERQYIPALHAPIASLTRIDGNSGIAQTGDVLLFAAFRNELPRLQRFLDHYRRLGVAQFVIVDNASTDDSVPFLLNHRDVILYQTDDRYAPAGMGMRWINELIDRHGRGNWCLHVDADEALVFPGDESLRLPALTAYLGARGYEAMLTPLLDMYPAKLPGPNGGDVAADWFSEHVFFDNPVYSRGHHVCPYRELYGGVRRRLFGGYQLLNKVALINGAAGIKFLLSGHRTTPARMADVTGALLHYHLVYVIEPEYRPILQEAISRREFASNALERLRSRELLSDMSPAQSLLCDDSVRFESAEQLVKLGIIRASDQFRDFIGAAAKNH